VLQVLLATSRVAGWCAHVLKQYANKRICRPRGRDVLRKPIAASSTSSSSSWDPVGSAFPASNA
jgi:citrate synthase